MSATLEQVMTALEAVFSALTTFAFVQREFFDPEGLGVAQSPGLSLLQQTVTYTRSGQLYTPKREMRVDAVFYVAFGSDTTTQPGTSLNAILYALDAALTPDPATGRFTLGGLVFQVMIEGDIKFSIGLLAGKSFASVPLRIILP